MTPEIKTSQKKTLAGISVEMSFQKNRTTELWQTFIPKKKNIPDVAGQNLYSVECYPDPGFFQNFDPARTFTKWAAVEVTGDTDLPDDFEILVLPEGLYAVFIYN